MELLIDAIIRGLPPFESWEIGGRPELKHVSFGEVVVFHGKEDMLLLAENPLKALERFTVEAIVCPDDGGETEQRFLHIGEAQGERVLLETRKSERGSWYLDVFVQSEKESLTLVESSKCHPFGEWVHVAFTNDRGRIKTFVNGVQEAEGILSFVPLSRGAMSIGARLNRVSWFTGSLWKVRLSEIVLETNSFLKLPESIVPSRC